MFHTTVHTKKQDSRLV